MDRSKLFLNIMVVVWFAVATFALDASISKINELTTRVQILEELK